MGSFGNRIPTERGNKKPRVWVECACGCGEKFSLPGYDRRFRRIRSNNGGLFLNREHFMKWRHDNAIKKAKRAAQAKAAKKST